MHYEEIEDYDPKGLRLCNTISLMVPAQTYHLNCAWTKEVSLPVVEEYTCRLLLALKNVLPGEIQEYFGLTKREVDVLAETLVHNKLAVVENDGHLAPSPMLLDRTKGDPNVAASLTQYEECIENPVIELLTLSVMPKSRYNDSRLGLLEIPIPDENKNLSVNQITEVFGGQYRAYLDSAVLQERDNRQKRLYKVGGCSIDRPAQIPIEIELSLLPVEAGDVHVFRRAFQNVGKTQKRAVSIELESRISDYLNGMRVSTDGTSLKEFCVAFNDVVLHRYVENDRLDINRWLLDHRNKKTGYDNPVTRAMIGPVYDKNNRITIEKALKEMAKDQKDGVSHNALWLSSAVPLWAANSSLLQDFCARIGSRLCSERNSRGKIFAILPCQHAGEAHLHRKAYGQRIPYGLGVSTGNLQDNVEIFLIPGQLAVVQYHIQPSPDTAITVPIGHMTCDPERLQKIEAFLSRRLVSRESPRVLWGGEETDLDSLLTPASLQVLGFEAKPQQ